MSTPEGQQRKAEAVARKLMARVHRVLASVTPPHNPVTVERIDGDALRSDYVDLVLTANSMGHQEAIRAGLGAVRDGIFEYEGTRTEPLADASGRSVRNQETVVIRAWRPPPNGPRAYCMQLLVVAFFFALAVATYAYMIFHAVSTKSASGGGGTPLAHAHAPAIVQPMYPPDDFDESDYVRHFDS